MLTYGDIMAEALRRGRPMSAPDGMIAAISPSMAGDWPLEIGPISKRPASI